MENILDKSCKENQNTNFMFNNFFSENVEKYGGARDAADDSTAASWMLD